MSDVLEFHVAAFWYNFFLLCYSLSTWRLMSFKLWRYFPSSLFDSLMPFVFSFWNSLSIFDLDWSFIHSVFLSYYPSLSSVSHLCVLFNYHYWFNTNNYHFIQHGLNQHWQRPFKKLMSPLWLMATEECKPIDVLLDVLTEADMTRASLQTS